MSKIETPRIGSHVITESRLTNGRVFEALETCDDWNAAEFRLPGYPGTPAVAVNVETTGRTVRTIGAAFPPVVRVRITFVGDGEPDVTVAGWMMAGTGEPAA